MDAELKEFFLKKAQETRELAQDLIKMKEILDPYAAQMHDPKMKNIVDIAIDALIGLKMLFSKIVEMGANSEERIANINIESLVSLADELDQVGLSEEAEKIDEMLKSAIEMPTDVVSNVPEQDIAKTKPDITALVSEFENNPTQESANAIQQKIEEILKDEESASIIKQQEESIGVPEGGWPDNPKYMMSKEIFEGLTKIADLLDEHNAKESADKIDAFLSKYAEDFLDYKGEDQNSEQAKRYDSKHHHALQIREPKKDQERVDLEGRKEHHVETQKSVVSYSLNTRYCPDHIGVSLGRVGENVYQCPLDGHVYNWETGWTDYDGNKHPGGSVAAQTPDSAGYNIPHRIFDTRENIKR